MSKTNYANTTKTALKSPKLQRVSLGGGKDFEPITMYYQFNEPRTPRENVGVINEGDVFEGTYEGSFIAGEYDKMTHKVRTSKGLIGLPDSGQLNKLMAVVATGATVKVEYKGKEEIQSGKWKGRLAHNFIVEASELTDSNEDAA